MPRAGLPQAVGVRTVPQSKGQKTLFARAFLLRDAIQRANDFAQSAFNAD